MQAYPLIIGVREVIRGIFVHLAAFNVRFRPGIAQ